MKNVHYLNKILEFIKNNIIALIPRQCQRNHSRFQYTTAAFLVPIIAVRFDSIALKLVKTFYLN